MARHPTLYTRLPGRTWLSLVGRHSVYAAEDHVLSVRYRYFTEEYKRSYFRDIQALIIRETPRRLVLTVVLGVAAALLLLAALSVPDRVGTAVFGAMALSCIVLLGINLLRGPTCTFHIQTPVHREEIACARRVPTAQRLVAELRPRIEAAQGALKRTDLRNRFAPAPTEPGSPPATEPIPLSRTAPPG